MIKHRGRQTSPRPLQVPLTEPGLHQNQRIPLFIKCDQLTEILPRSQTKNNNKNNPSTSSVGCWEYNNNWKRTSIGLLALVKSSHRCDSHTNQLSIQRDKTSRKRTRLGICQTTIERNRLLSWSNHWALKLFHYHAVRLARRKP